jgi:predicted nucleic acid-binding protein
MNAIDTNVLVYRPDRSDPVKQAKARELLRRLAADTEPTVLPWQVLGELIRQLRFWQDNSRSSCQVSPKSPRNWPTDCTRPRGEILSST